jgi:solute carrier family 4 (sodium bicarbonate transporter), member 10
MHINNNKIKKKQSFQRFCGGLIDDLKRKLPWFLSDFRDGLNFQCLSSVLFMYFACLSPIITFGGLLGTATDQNMVRILFVLTIYVYGMQKKKEKMINKINMALI